MSYFNTVSVDINVDDILDRIEDEDKLDSIDLEVIKQYILNHDEDNEFTLQNLWDYMKLVHPSSTFSIDDFKAAVNEFIDDNFYLIKR